MGQRDELANLIDDAIGWAGEEDIALAEHVTDAILAAGYVKADSEEWAVQSPFGNIRPCINEHVARIPSANWTTIRRIVGPWEVA